MIHKAVPDKVGMNEAVPNKVDFDKAVFAQAACVAAGFPKLAGAVVSAAHMGCPKTKLQKTRALAVAAVLATRNLALAQRRADAAAVRKYSLRQMAQLSPRVSGQHSHYSARPPAPHQKS